MQYGTLTTSQKTLFNTRQSSSVRKPTFAVWIESFGDVTDHVIEIDSEIAIESLKGSGSLNIGRAILQVNNPNGVFYFNGASNIRTNARIKIWAGFDGLNISIFTGVVHNIKPVGTSNIVVMNCRDYMGLFFEAMVKDSQDPNNTPKLMIENFCSNAMVDSDVTAIDETTETYNYPKFDEQRIISALEKICGSIFHTAYFNENGTLQFCEREYSNIVNWRFDDQNVSECTLLSNTEIINEVTIEYSDGFFSCYSDQGSVDEYGTNSKTFRVLLLNSSLVSDNIQGSAEEELNHDLEGFKFTSSNDSGIIDCIHIKMKKSDAHGFITIKIYSNGGGLPDTLLGFSQLKASDNLENEFAWECFCFDTPVKISPSTDYWIVIDTSEVSSGNIYIQTNTQAATAKYAYYDSGAWYTENNKMALHRIRGSNQAQRIAEDMVRFYRIPHERIRIIAPAVPQLQLTDTVWVEAKTMGIAGHYVIEGRRHILTPEKYITIDTLRKVG